MEKHRVKLCIVSNELSSDEVFEIVGDLKASLREDVGLEASRAENDVQDTKSVGIDILTLLISSGALAKLAKYLFDYLKEREGRLKGQSIEMEIEHATLGKRKIKIKGNSDPETILKLIKQNGETGT